MKKLAVAALLVAGCHAKRPPQWAGIRDGMKLAEAVEALKDAGADVRVSARDELGFVLVGATLKDGTRAKIPFTPEGDWSYISVISPELAPADAEALRRRVAAHLGPPPDVDVALNAEWSNDMLFHSRDERSGHLGTVESLSGTAGPVGIGPRGLEWGMTPRAVRIAIEGQAGDLTDDEGELEFGGGADGSWLAATFDDKHHLTHVVTSTSPPLERDAAYARLRALEAQAGAANTVEELDEWWWTRGPPSDSVLIRIVHVRGQPTAHVEQLYMGVPLPRSALPD